MNVVRSLRRKAGLSQAALARVAATSQPTIAAYESGKKSPSWRTLSRLTEAAGVELYPLMVPPLTREDRRSLFLHAAISKRLRDDPRAVLAKAKRNAESMRRQHPHAAPLLDVWKQLLECDPQLVVDILEDPRPLARELRHVTPFAGVLDHRERAELYRAFRLEEAGAA
jgi:transcriptional regulator with XRE-family HTH domain